MQKLFYLIAIILTLTSQTTVAQLHISAFEMNSGELRSIYHQKITFNEKYRSSLDAGSYLGLGNNVWTRWGIRGGLIRIVNSRTSVDVGFMYNHVTFDHKISQEFRPHQSVLVNYPTLPNSAIQHRLRLEERIFIDDINDVRTTRSRIRYRISNSGTLKGKPVAPKSFFYRLSAEWNFNVYNEIEGAFLLRGRYGIGYGYQFNSRYTADATYYFQHDAQQDNDHHNIIHIFQLTLRHSIRLN